MRDKLCVFMIATKKKDSFIVSHYFACLLHWPNLIRANKQARSEIIRQQRGKQWGGWQIFIVAVSGTKNGFVTRQNYIFSIALCSGLCIQIWSRSIQLWNSTYKAKLFLPFEVWKLLENKCQFSGSVCCSGFFILFSLSAVSSKYLLVLSA